MENTMIKKGDFMIIKINNELSAEKILNVVKDLLNRNQPIPEDKALSITIVDIIDYKEKTKNLEHF